MEIESLGRNFLLIAQSKTKIPNDSYFWDNINPTGHFGDILQEQVCLQCPEKNRLSNWAARKETWKLRWGP